MWGIGTYFNRIDGLFEKLNNVHGKPSGYNQALCACMVTDAFTGHTIKLPCEEGFLVL